MTCGSLRQYRTKSSGPRHGSRGFTLLELLLVILIVGILCAMAIPMIVNTLHVYTLRSSVSAVTGAIEATRYQAIYHGCQYQLAFNAAASNYTVQSAAPAVGGTSCLAALGAAGTPIPLPGKGVTLGGNVTLLFHPSGQVVAVVGTMNPITMTYTGLPVESITVSAYGRVYVTP